MIRDTRRHNYLNVLALTIASLLLFPLVMFSATAQAQVQDTISPRLQIGINLLPAIIAANKSVINSEPNTELSIYLVYKVNRHLAEQLQTRLAERGAIRERRLEIAALNLSDLLTRKLPPNSTIFIVEPSDTRLEQLIEFALQQRALLFSPYQGDVELGVNAGFKVTDKVLPLVNIGSLKRSKIQLKAFFLRIAVKHE
jgi:hypothetical protein